MWPNRLPYIGNLGNIAQPQPSLIPMQIPLQNPYLQQQPFITNQLMPNLYQQPKIVYAQPLPYRPVVNQVYVPPNIHYLPYHRPEVSHVTSYIPAVKQYATVDDSKNSTAASSSDREQSVASADDAVSLSSRSSHVGSPLADGDELPLVLDDACALNDYTDQAARFYDAFYEVCCQSNSDQQAAEPDSIPLTDDTAAETALDSPAMDCDENMTLNDASREFKPEMDCDDVVEAAGDVTAPDSTAVSVVSSCVSDSAHDAALADPASSGVTCVSDAHDTASADQASLDVSDAHDTASADQASVIQVHSDCSTVTAASNSDRTAEHRDVENAVDRLEAASDGPVRTVEAPRDGPVRTFEAPRSHRVLPVCQLPL